MTCSARGRTSRRYRSGSRLRPDFSHEHGMRPMPAGSQACRPVIARRYRLAALKARSYSPNWAMAQKIPHPNLVLATCILASSLAFVDGSVTNVALPALGKALGGSAADLQWVINAYLLPLSALLLLGGAAGDRYGRVRLLAGGT